MVKKRMAKSVTGKEINSYYDELVPIMLIKDNAKYKDDLTVTVNGINYQIQRGAQVMVPRKVALAVERSRNQELEAQAYVESLKG